MCLPSVMAAALSQLTLPQDPRQEGAVPSLHCGGLGGAGRVGGGPPRAEGSFRWALLHPPERAVTDSRVWNVSPPPAGCLPGGIILDYPAMSSHQSVGGSGVGEGSTSGPWVESGGVPGKSRHLHSSPSPLVAAPTGRPGPQGLPGLGLSGLQQPLVNQPGVACSKVGAGGPRRGPALQGRDPGLSRLHIISRASTESHPSDSQGFRPSSQQVLELPRGGAWAPAQWAPVTLLPPRDQLPSCRPPQVSLRSPPSLWPRSIVPE